MNHVETAAAPRPLWRRIADFPLVTMLIAIAIFIFGGTVATLLGKLLPPVSAPWTPEMIIKLIAIVIWLLLYKLTIRHLGEHPRDDFRADGAMRNTALGLAAGVVIMAAVVGVAAIVDVYNIIGSGTLSDLLPAIISLSIFPAVSEELMFRGILFRWIEEFGGSWTALLLTSALFGGAHLMNPNASPIAAFAIAIEAGVLLGGAYMLTRSLWLPMGMHAAWNFTQGEIFDVPVSGLESHGFVEMRLSGPELLSGGQFGLEASVIAMVIATAAGVWLVYLAIKRGELMSPWWVRRRAISKD